MGPVMVTDVRFIEDDIHAKSKAVTRGGLVLSCLFLLFQLVAILLGRACGGIDGAVATCTVVQEASLAVIAFNLWGGGLLTLLALAVVVDCMRNDPSLA